MRVLLIGGSGFIGQAVVNRLQQRGHDVIVFHRGQTGALTELKVQHILGNRLNIEDSLDDIKKVRPEVAIDLLPWNDKDTRRVIDVLNGRMERVVHLSSGDVYRAWGNLLKGRYGEPVPLTEKAPLRDEFFPYAGTQPGMDDYDKVLAEREILKAHFEEDYPGVIVRLPMVYGPGDRQHRTWPYVKRMVDGRPAILLTCAHAGWLWQRGYVDNVAFGIVLAAERTASVGQIYNVGSADTLGIAGWVQAIGRVMNWDGEIVLMAERDLPHHLMAPYNYAQHILFDTGKIRRELGYYELVQPEDALQRTVEWQVAHPPSAGDEDRFDYQAEDAALADLADD